MPAPLMPPPTTQHVAAAGAPRARRGRRLIDGRVRSHESSMVWLRFRASSFRFSRLSAKRMFVFVHADVAEATTLMHCSIRSLRFRIAMNPNPRQVRLLDEVRAARQRHGRGAGRAASASRCRRCGATCSCWPTPACWRASTAACACRARPPRTSPTASASSSTTSAKQRIARAVARGGAARLLADHQHRHHHRGDRARAAAAQGPARDHQQPERRGDPVRQPRLRGDRRRRHGALARPRHRRRGDGRLHPPVQGRHRR